MLCKSISVIVNSPLPFNKKTCFVVFGVKQFVLKNRSDASGFAGVWKWSPSLWVRFSEQTLWCLSWSSQPRLPPLGFSIWQIWRGDGRHPDTSCFAPLPAFGSAQNPIHHCIITLLLLNLPNHATILMQVKPTGVVLCFRLFRVRLMAGNECLFCCALSHLLTLLHQSSHQKEIRRLFKYVCAVTPCLQFTHCSWQCSIKRSFLMELYSTCRTVLCSSFCDLTIHNNILWIR